MGHAWFSVFPGVVVPCLPAVTPTALPKSKREGLQCLKARDVSFLPTPWAVQIATVPRTVIEVTCHSPEPIHFKEKVI